MYYPLKAPDGTEVYPIAPSGYESRWICGKEKFDELNKSNLIEWKKNGNNEWNVYQKFYLEGRLKQPGNLWVKVEGNKKATRDVRGSGTTGHAVMQQNADDGGNRKFILCQIDEPIDQIKKKEAYDFCISNNLEPAISSLTIERLKRAGEKITLDIETANSKTGMFEEDKKQVPDLGFKVFDSVIAPKLQVDENGQISINIHDGDALSRIYNMVFTVGLDEPTQVPVEVVKDCIYKIGKHYYITNSEKISKEDFSNAIKSGKVFIDGWTASLSGTLQNYKEDVKIVF